MMDNIIHMIGIEKKIIQQTMSNENKFLDPANLNTDLMLSRVQVDQQERGYKKYGEEILVILQRIWWYNKFEEVLVVTLKHIHFCKTVLLHKIFRLFIMNICV